MQNTILQPNTPRQKSALRSLALNREIFLEIGQRILLAYSQTTKNDAAMASGMYAYLAAVKAVRDVLHGKNWTASKNANIELAASEELKANILVSSGNKYIGQKKGDPGSKNKKGRQVQKIICKNFRQLSLLPELDIKKQCDDESFATWFLFYHFDIKKCEMRMEISLPTQFNFDELKVTGWKQRILLNPIEFDPVPVDIEHDFAPEIKFDIKRKKNGE